MSFFAQNYVALFPQAEAVLASNPEAALLAQRWHLTADRQSALYGATN